MIYDINLIPKNRAKTSEGSNAVLLVLYAAATISLVLFGFYFPFKQKLQLISQIQDQENLLLSYADTQGIYSSLQSQIEELKKTDSMMDTIKDSGLKMTKMLDDIETGIPKNIIINAMSMETGLLTIEGTSPSYTEVAEFLVNLRSMKNVSGVTFMSAKEDTASTEPDSSNDEKQLYAFTVYVKYNSMDALAVLQATQDNVMNTEGQEDLQDETN